MSSARGRRVSVVIPLYNHESFIDLALDSLLAQEERPYEIIVVDDGSTDRSLARAVRRSKSIGRMRVTSQRNQGSSAAMNAGIASAKGQYIAILNSDDMYHPQRLRRCLEVVEREPGVDLVVSGVEFVDDHGRVIVHPWYGDARAFMNRTRDFALALVNANIAVSTSNFFVDRRALCRVGAFRPYRYAQDLDLLLRLCAARATIVMLDDPLLHYRFHAANTILENHARVRVEMGEVIAGYVLAVGPDYSDRRLAQLLDLLRRHDLLEIVIARVFIDSRSHAHGDATLDRMVALSGSASTTAGLDA